MKCHDVIKYNMSLVLVSVLGSLAGLVSGRMADTATIKVTHTSHKRHAANCSAHQMLYGQIHQDLMPWALNGIHPEHMAMSHELCTTNPGLFTCVLIQDGQVRPSVPVS